LSSLQRELDPSEKARSIRAIAMYDLARGVENERGERADGG